MRTCRTEPKSVGHIKLVLVLIRPLSFNLFDIAYSGLKSFGDGPISNLPAFCSG